MENCFFALSKPSPRHDIHCVRERVFVGPFDATRNHSVKQNSYIESRMAFLNCNEFSFVLGPKISFAFDVDFIPVIKLDDKIRDIVTTDNIRYLLRLVSIAHLCSFELTVDTLFKLVPRTRLLLNQLINCISKSIYFFQGISRFAFHKVDRTILI